MKKKLLTTILTFGLAATMSVPTFAADGDAATSPKDSGAESGASSGSATITGDSTGAMTSITGDDDALAGGEDTNGADINVWAKVLDSSTKIYKVDLGWGAMKFEYSSTAGQWNPETHTYANAQAGGTSGWTLDGYLPETDAADTVDTVNIVNNEVMVTNHSNNAVTAGFTYAMDNTAFNDNVTDGDDSVRGHFFETTTAARTAAGVLTNSAVVTDGKTGLALHTADAYSTVADATDDTNNVAPGARSDSMYFAFSGTPDAGKGADLNTFKKVGVITVSIAPKTDMADEYAAYTGA